jgi:hypothetical protein
VKHKVVVNKVVVPCQTATLACLTPRNLTPDVRVIPEPTLPPATKAPTKAPTTSAPVTTPIQPTPAPTPEPPEPTSTPVTQGPTEEPMTSAPVTAPVPPTPSPVVRSKLLCPVAADQNEEAMPIDICSCDTNPFFFVFAQIQTATPTRPS